MPLKTRENVAHYTWGQACDGWRLVDEPGLAVVEERMPPGTSEVRHRHERARQFFFVLEGQLVVEVEGIEQVVLPGQGFEVAPLAAHQVFNKSASDARFLVVSSPTSRGDRVLASGSD